MKDTEPTKTLLVANGIVAQRVATPLAEAGLEVDQASDCLQALVALEEGSYQLILLDFRLPDAYDACRQINSIFGTPLMIIEDHFADEDWVSLMSLVVDGYLPAEAKDAEILARINSHLRRNGHLRLRVAA